MSGRWWAQESRKNTYDVNSSINNDNEIDVRKRLGPKRRFCCRPNYEVWEVYFKQEKRGMIWLNRILLFEVLFLFFYLGLNYYNFFKEDQAYCVFASV